MTSLFSINVYNHGNSKSVFRGYFKVNNTTDIIEHFYDHSSSPAIDILMTGSYFSSNKFKDGKFTGNGTTITSMPSVDAQYNSVAWLFTPEAWHYLKNGVAYQKGDTGWWWYTGGNTPFLQYSIQVCACISLYSVRISQKSTGVELTIVNVFIDEDKIVDAEKMGLNIIAGDNQIIPNGVIYNKTHRLIKDLNIANIPALDVLNGATEWNIIWKDDHGLLKLL